MTKLSKKEIIEDLLTRSIFRIEIKKNLHQKLESGQKLKIKLGIDPTAVNLHLGHAVLLLKLKRFQELGHQIILIVGDFTGLVGDTSDKDAERPMLSKEQVQKNLKTYIKQFGKIVDIKKTEIKHNSEWLAKLDFWELSKQASVFSLNEFISRTNIKTRLKKGSRISVRELIYPLMQAYDSVAIRADVEIGGSDQWFNLLSGRTLQKSYQQPPQNVLTVKLLEGPDGRKMSSSWKNTINILDEPQEMFGKVMSINDELIIPYFEHCTELPLVQIKELQQQLKRGKNPKDIKEELAKAITKIYWGAKGTDIGQGHFQKVIREKTAPTDLKTIKVTSSTVLLVLAETKLVKSKGEARRLITQGGIKLNGQVIKSPDQKVKSGDILQKGKREWLKIE
ncbi:MAG: tyrosine--tRNA ligase [Patescibacteria group bacterium]